MMMKAGKIHTDIEQGTPEWHAMKAGKLSASKIKDALAGGKGLTRDKLMLKLALERMTGKPISSYSSFAMQQGMEREPLARAAYEFIKGVEVEEVGFVEHPFIPMAGCSPDGLVDGRKGGTEFKCPEPHTHLAYLRAGVAAPEYNKQYHFQMACAGLEWVDFVSHCPEYPDGKLQTLIVRVERDDKLIDELEDGAILFLKDVNALVDELNEMAGAS